MAKDKKSFPSTEERFDGIITGLSNGEFFPASASATIADIHHANVGELLDQVEGLIPPTKFKEFATLRKQYTA